MIRLLKKLLIYLAFLSSIVSASCLVYVIMWLNALRKGGIFVSTWAFGTHTHWNEKASATVLSETDAEHIFKSNWKIKPDFEKISNEYKENIFLLKEWHLKRFGNLTIDYVHAGNILVKK